MLRRMFAWLNIRLNIRVLEAAYYILDEPGVLMEGRLALTKAAG